MKRKNRNKDYQLLLFLVSWLLWKDRIEVKTIII